MTSVQLPIPQVGHRKMKTLKLSCSCSGVFRAAYYKLNLFTNHSSFIYIYYFSFMMLFKIYLSGHCYGIANEISPWQYQHPIFGQIFSSSHNCSSSLLMHLEQQQSTAQVLEPPHPKRRPRKGSTSSNHLDGEPMDGIYLCLSLLCNCTFQVNIFVTKV